MSRFYSIPGMAPSGGEGGMNAVAAPSGLPPGYEAREDPHFREFFAERDRMRREQPDFFRSGFTPGDRERFGDQEVTVEHVEHDQHTGKETLWMRGDDTGTFTATWEKQDHDTAVIVKAKPVKE